MRKVKVERRKRKGERVEKEKLNNFTLPQRLCLFAKAFWCLNFPERKGELFILQLK